MNKPLWTKGDILLIGSSIKGLDLKAGDFVVVDEYDFTIDKYNIYQVNSNLEVIVDYKSPMNMGDLYGRYAVDSPFLSNCKRIGQHGEIFESLAKDLYF